MCQFYCQLFHLLFKVFQFEIALFRKENYFIFSFCLGPQDAQMLLFPSFLFLFVYNFFMDDWLLVFYNYILAIISELLTQKILIMRIFPVSLQLVLEGLRAKQVQDALLMDKRMLERETQQANSSVNFYEMKVARIEDQVTCAL